MKTKLIVLGITVLLSVSCMGQTTTCRVKNVKLETVFQEIKRQTGYVFIYPLASLQKAKLVSLAVRKADIKTVLDLCMNGQPFAYVIKEKTVIISEVEPISSFTGIPNIVIEGYVRNEQAQALDGVTVEVKGGIKISITDQNGWFRLTASPNAILRFYSVNMQTLEIPVNGRGRLDVQLQSIISRLEDVLVRGNSGYQYFPKERATGSWELVSNELLERSVNTNILDRLDGTTLSVLFNKNIQPATNQPNLSVRGRSTIYANANPLVVLDNFPFDGNLSMINPADVESITILKDAATASIWGAFSGNGVIVITTKKGRYDQAKKFTLIASASGNGKPDLDYYPGMSSTDYISVERFLYSKGYYHSILQTGFLLASPYLEILSRQSNGLVTPAQAATAISSLQSTDTRTDIRKYFYRPAIEQHYHLQASGGNSHAHYYLSAGYDHNHSNAVNESYRRITLNSYNGMAFFHHRLETTLMVGYANSLTRNNNPDLLNSLSIYPYLQLADSKGQALEIPRYLRQGYTDTAGGGSLLDWSYRPLDELKYQNNRDLTTDFHIDAGLTYTIKKGWTLSSKYRFSKGSFRERRYYSLQTFYARNLINSFAQADSSTGAISYGIPYGGVIDGFTDTYHSHQARLQTDYARGWTANRLSLIAGAEVKTVIANSGEATTYGYDASFNHSTQVNYAKDLPLYFAPGFFEDVNGAPESDNSFTHFLSFYGKANYSRNEKYFFSTSLRRDASNLFGVNSNNKGQPFYSFGIGWDISREHFYHVSWLKLLKLRLSQGYNGNIFNSISAFTTIHPAGKNRYNQPIDGLVNPPNPSLRWEKSSILNAGIDFIVGNKLLYGSVEWYSRKGVDLIGNSVSAPQTGITTYIGNSAALQGWGIDISLNSIIKEGRVTWSNNFNLSYHTEWVSGYKVRQSSIGYYMNNERLSPLEGFPVFSVYALRWAGLDAAGNPQIYMDGKPSENYAAIVNSPNLSNMQFIGSAIPTLFGNWRQGISMGRFTLSLNIIFKLGYYFRAHSLSYSELFAGFTAEPDYNNRWQKAGDELNTQVPSMIYPANTNRDLVYRYANIMVEKGDHIRLLDLRLAYAIPHKKTKLKANVFLSASNLGILWRVNHKGIDPDYYMPGVYPQPKSIAGGIKLDF